MKNKNNLNLVLVIGLMLILGCMCPAPKESSKTSNTTSNQTAQANTNTDPGKPKETAFDINRDGLVLVSAKWEKGGFGSIGIWKVTIKNVSDKQLGDIKFRTAYYSETGNTVSKGGVDGLLGKDTIQKLVPPKSTRTFEVNDGFISDEAVKAGFDLVSWRVIAK